MNKPEHSDFEHCIKKLTEYSLLSEFLHFRRTNFAADTLLYRKFIARNKTFLLVKRRNFLKTKLKILFPFSIVFICSTFLSVYPCTCHHLAPSHRKQATVGKRCNFSEKYLEKYRCTPELAEPCATRFAGYLF